MVEIIATLFYIFISLVVLYLVIKTAINHADIFRTNNEIRTLQTQLNRQHEELIKQIEDLKQVLIEQKKDSNKDHNNEH